MAFCRLFRCSPFSSHWLLSWGGIFWRVKQLYGESSCSCSGQANPKLYDYKNIHIIVVKQMRCFLFHCFFFFFYVSAQQKCEDRDSFFLQTSCEEYLCDVLCFRLDLACFVSSVNSGRPWNLRNSLLFSQQDQGSDVDIAEILDPFVENLILERLAVQTPMRVSSNFSCIIFLISCMCFTCCAHICTYY